MYKAIMELIICLIDAFLYFEIDGKCRVTKKINSKLNINKEWRSHILAIIVYMSGFIIITTVRLRRYTTNIFDYLVTQDLFFGITMCLSERIVSQCTAKMWE